VPVRANVWPRFASNGAMLVVTPAASMRSHCTALKRRQRVPINSPTFRRPIVRFAAFASPAVHDRLSRRSAGLHSMKLDQYQWTSTTGWDRPLLSSPLCESAQLVWLFGNPRAVDIQRNLPLVRRAFPHAHVFGCSTGGEIRQTQVRDETLALTAMTFEHSHVATSRVTIRSVDESFAAGQQLVRQLNPQGLRHIFVLSEGILVNGSDLVDGINVAAPAGVSVSGGFAGDGDNLQKTHVWCDGEPEQRAAIAVGFYGQRLQIGVSVTGGWGPFGPDRLITKSNKNVLYEFDGRPALALYKQYLGDYASGLPVTGLMFPLELRTGRGENRVLRALLAIDEATQSITYAGNVPEGAYARFMVGHIEDLIDGTLKAAQASRAAMQTAPASFSLLVSCNARRAVLKQRVEEEVEAVRDVLGSQAVLAGFYSYGEIGPPVTGGGSELHNETMTITNFAEV
jgi:hypothetical protein